MKWSLKIIRVAGIDVAVHVTFPLLLIWVAWVNWSQHHDLQMVYSNIVLILALFVCVVLHELGHALTARRFGITTQHITLLPIGGVAAMEKMPEKPSQELLVAIAGPMVNVVIAALIYLWFQLNPEQLQAAMQQQDGGSIWYQLLIINIILVVFNMLPAFPMDGGRVLRAALAMRMKHLKATRIASKIGQVLAVAMFLLGWLYNPFLMFIAIFIWFGANAEAGMEEVNNAIDQVTVRHAMMTRFLHLQPDDRLKNAIALTLQGTQRDFPIIPQNFSADSRGKVLSHAAILQSLQLHGENKILSELDLPDLEVVNEHEKLKNVLERFQRHDSPLIAVSDGYRIIGIINLENIMELISFQKAVQENLVA